jgi:hypothetical protein
LTLETVRSVKTLVQESAYDSPAWIPEGPVRTGAGTGQVAPRAPGAHAPAKAASSAERTIDRESQELEAILL